MLPETFMNKWLRCRERQFHRGCLFFIISSLITECIYFINTLIINFFILLYLKNVLIHEMMIRHLVLDVMMRVVDVTSNVWVVVHGQTTRVHVTSARTSYIRGSALKNVLMVFLKSITFILYGEDSMLLLGALFFISLNNMDLVKLFYICVCFFRGRGRYVVSCLTRLLLPMVLLSPPHSLTSSSSPNWNQFQYLPSTANFREYFILSHIK